MCVCFVNKPSGITSNSKSAFFSHISDLTRKVRRLASKIFDFIKRCYKNLGTFFFKNDRKECDSQLKKTCNDFARISDSFKGDSYFKSFGLLSLILVDIKEDESSDGFLHVDAGSFSLPQIANNNAESVFISDEYDHDKDLINYCAEIKTAFDLGKKFVVLRLGDEQHSVVAAFKNNGKFIVVDSMSSQILNVKEIANELNGKEIVNKKGKKISFEGKYINTHIQKGGHECLRFSTLYGYQMCIKQSFKGYQEVNGAFAEGHLKCIDDIENISGAKLLKDASNVDKSKYKPFMHSWAYRIGGFKVNDWKEIKLGDIYDNPNKKEFVKLKIKNLNDLDCESFPLDILRDEDIKYENAKIIPLSDDWRETTLGSFKFSDNQSVVIVCLPNVNPQIFLVPS